MTMMTKFIKRPCWSITILFLSALINISEEYKEGAPFAACKQMIPLHLGNPLINPSPYVISAFQDSYKAGDTIKISVRSGPLKLPFKGFLVQARDSWNNIIGSFEPSEHARLMNCTSGIGNSITHVNDTDKHEVILYWKVPESFKEAIQFHLTIARNYRSYWAGEKTKELLYNNTAES